MHPRRASDHRAGKEGQDVKPTPARQSPTRRKQFDADKEEELNVEKQGISSTNVRIEKGVVVVNQESDHHSIRMHEGSGSEISVEIKEKSIEVHGPVMHFKMEETDASGRKITFFASDESQGFYERTIEMGKNHPTARLGDFLLKHGEGDELEISMEENLLEKDKLIIRGFGENRDIEYRYADKIKLVNHDININSAANSKKATGEEIKGIIIEWAERNYGKLYGGTRGVVGLVDKFTGIDRIKTPEVAVRA